MADYDEQFPGIKIIRLPEPDFPVVPTDENSVYLGDAVYATVDPGGENGMIVWTDRKAGRHWMGVSGRGIEALYAFGKASGLIKE